MAKIISSSVKLLCATWLAAGAVYIPVSVRAADETAGKPAVEGTVELTAAKVVITGPNAKLEGCDQRTIIWWTHRDTSLAWTANFPRPGKYRVGLDYYVVGSNNGSPLTIDVGSQTLNAIPRAGNGIGEYRRGVAGTVTIDKAGPLPVVVKSAAGAREFVLNLRSIVFTPADADPAADDIGDSPIKQAADGSLMLTAADAAIGGMNAQLEGGKEKNIGFWRGLDTSVEWTANLEKSGKYRVELIYSLSPNASGSKVAVQVGDQTLRVRPKPGKDWGDYKTGVAGEVTIEKPGGLRIEVRPVSIANTYAINLRAIVLQPAELPTKADDIADPPVSQGANGGFKLTATDAEIDGSTCRLEGGEKKYVVWWNSPFTSMQWPIKIKKPGLCTVQLTYSLGNTETNSEIDLTIGGQTVHGTLPPGPGLDDFKTLKIGDINLPKIGDFEVKMKSTKEPGGLVMHFDSISLIPVQKK